MLADWTRRIKDWHAQEKVLLKDKTVENPYLSVWRKGQFFWIYHCIVGLTNFFVLDEVTEKKIEADLEREEREDEIKMGVDEAAKKMNVVVFVRLALQLQQVQYVAVNNFMCFEC